jgi:hypothetical protein
MAANEIEHYRSFYIRNYTHPYGVNGRVSEEDAKKLSAYVIVKRDEKNRIISMQDLYDGGKKVPLLYRV